MTNTFDLHFWQLKNGHIGFFALAGLVVLLGLADALLLKNNFTFGAAPVSAASLCKLDSLYNGFGDSESYINVASGGKMSTQNLSLLATNWRSSW
jgi:hypothetical protein